MNEASTRSLEMRIAPPVRPGGRVALINSGYWGINTSRTGTQYQLKFYLRPGHLPGAVAATLETQGWQDAGPIHDFGAVAPGEHMAAVHRHAQGHRHRSAGALRAAFRGSGTVQVDWVSLFPPTYKNRPNGLRPDLAKYLEELKPAFIRYPGGCYVEGLSWESAPDWRKMVCPPEERPGMWGYWQYRSTDGFGYHEFLQFCEDIGAESACTWPSAGMTVHPENNMPLDRIDPVIQRTLDAIEYARGPVDSKWGAGACQNGTSPAVPLALCRDRQRTSARRVWRLLSKFRRGHQSEVSGNHVCDEHVLERAESRRHRPRRRRQHRYRRRTLLPRRPAGSAPTSTISTSYPRKHWKIYVGEYASHHDSGDWYGGMGDSALLMMSSATAIW